MAAKKRRPYGAGTVRERVLKDGTVHYQVLAKVDGKQKLIGTCESLEEVDQVVALHVTSRQVDGKYAPYDFGVMTLRRAGHLYLDALPASRLVTDRSRWAARVATAEFVDWPLTQLSEQAVRRWVAKMATTEIATGKSAGQRPTRSTLQSSLNLLRDALKWAVINGHIDRNVAKGVTISESTAAAPKSSAIGDIYDYLREDEVRRLIEGELPAKQKAAFTLLAFTGARPKDLYLLDWSGFDLKGAQIRFWTHKKGRHYTVPLLPPALEAIRTWWLAHGQPATGLVFSGPRGAPHTRGYDFGWQPSEKKPGKITRGYREQLGIKRDVPLYSLRHTAATALLLGWNSFTGGRRWSPEEVASFLGHSDLSTVRRYMVGLNIASVRAAEESREAIKALKPKGGNVR